jgi:hypothetical protein
MTPPNASDSEGIQEARLPSRDWIVLPLIGVATILLLAVSTELMARRLFPESQTRLESCFAGEIVSGIGDVTPNSVCSERIPESKFLAEYRFDGSGHRADMENGPRQPGTYRIEMIGSSFAFGLFVPREMSFAGLLPAELSRETGRKIEVYNAATGGEYRGGPYPVPGSVQHFNEILATHPEMILWIITPNDINTVSFTGTGSAPAVATQDVSAQSSPTGPLADAGNRLRAAVNQGRLEERLRNRWEQSRASLALKHFLIQGESQDEYVKSYLKNEDSIQFLKIEPNAKWRSLMGEFELDASEFAKQAKAAGVPIVAVLVPDRVQAAMVSMGKWPAGYDPYKLDEELRQMIVSRGGTYVDILPDFREIPNPEEHYFPVDGHPDTDAHAVLAKLLARELTSGAVPALKAISQTQTALEQGR